jgi:hypothetical protein
MRPNTKIDERLTGDSDDMKAFIKAGTHKNWGMFQ